MKGDISKKKIVISRRNVLKNIALFTGLNFPGTTTIAKAFYGNSVNNQSGDNFLMEEGELLYNGIQLPKRWPPRNIVVDSYDPMPLPYLHNPPKVISIDVGRQLFVDDFLIEKTDAVRKFYQPDKYAVNPLIKPERQWEMNKGFCAMAAPFSDGVFFDPDDKLFKMWYMAGWYDNKTAFAKSIYGIHWERPSLNIIPNTNISLITPQLQRDGASVWIDHDTLNRVCCLTPF